MCIKAPSKEVLKGLKVDNLLEVGNEYMVTNQCQEFDGLWYQIVGFPGDWGFDSRLFATLPGLTADEMEEIEKEAILL